MLGIDVNMQSLGLVILLVAAASAFPTDKHFYRCTPYLSDHSVVFLDHTFLCDSYDDQRYLVARDSQIDDFLVWRDTRTFPILGALGGSAAGSAAQSSAGSITGGIGGGLLPFSLGASVSGAQSSAASGVGGGALGLLG